MKPDRHIILTGFMGAGKSTLGKGLAEILKWQFHDLDETIAENEGQEVRKILEAKGEAAFRKIETMHMQKLIVTAPPAIVALGGGAICSQQNLQLAKQNGFLVYLRLPETVLFERLERHTDSRPLLRGLKGGFLRSRIHELVEDRQKYYLQAHLVVDAQYLTPQLLYREISASYENMPR